MTTNAPHREFAAERQARLRRQEQELRSIHDSVETSVETKGDGTSAVSNAQLLQAIEGLRKEVAELRGNQEMAAPESQAEEVAPESAAEEAAPESATEDDAPEGPTKLDNDHDVKVEIAQMVLAISRAKTEIAAIKHPQADEDQLSSVAKQLDAVVDATESATNTILESNEKIEEAIHKIGQSHHNDEEIQVMVDQVATALVAIYEACNFQDITGQRVGKVVKTLRFIEDRILAMIGIWGTEAFIDLPVTPGTDAAQASDAEDPDNLMNGPQLAAEAITQADIDALFD